MSRVQAVKSLQHAHFSWRSYDNLRFAAGDAYAPLLIQEFLQAGATAPIAFTHSDEGYRPILMMGLRASQNLLVSSKTGKWLGSYVPAWYRSHPFCMARTQNGKNLLSVHADSEFVFDRPAKGEARPFFVGGELSKELAGIRDFLQHVEAGRLTTVNFADLCNQLDLFCPWEAQLSSGGQPVKIKGLHRIDEKKLRGLPAESATSLQHIKRLQALSQRAASANGKAESMAPIEQMLGPSEADDSIDLEWFRQQTS
jgi:hypothetical protein